MRKSWHIFSLPLVLLTIFMSIKSTHQTVSAIERISLRRFADISQDLKPTNEHISAESTGPMPAQLANNPVAKAIALRRFTGISPAAHPPTETTAEETFSRASQKKIWTVIIYMAGDNDLFPFAKQNLAQMKEIGSSEHCNILVYFNTHLPGREKTTKLLYIDKKRIVQIGPDFKSDSGSAEALANTVIFAERNFPAEHVAIVFWNHGSGDLNPVLRHTVNPAYLFRYNPETNLVELDRRIPFMEFIDMLSKNDPQTEPAETQKRGICFDDTYHTYLDDQKLMNAFGLIVDERGGEKIDMVIFDACLMAGTGTSYITGQFADCMVASQEVVLGPGYNYRYALAPFVNGISDKKLIATHIVNTYENLYSPITQDYTHSAFDLHVFNEVNKNIDEVALLLVEGLSNQKSGSVRNAIRAARNPRSCIHFDEPSYIDLKSLYKNLLIHLDSMELKTKSETFTFRSSLKKALENGLNLINKYVIANVCGANLSGAGGLSIYFPERRINNPHHASYQHTEFAKHNNWINFLRKYL